MKKGEKEKRKIFLVQSIYKKGKKGKEKHDDSNWKKEIITKQIRQLSISATYIIWTNFFQIYFITK